MEQLIKNLATIGSARLIMLAVVGLGILVGVAMVATLATSPSMRILYSNLEPSDAGQVALALDQMGVPYESAPDGAAIYIAESDVGRIRMLLAQQGLPSSGTMGYELFDNASPLGTSSYVQQINRVRSLEGELSRSIQTMNGVKAARVHIVMPEREAFSQRKTPASASVVVTMGRSLSLDREMALAIRHLVASAVPALSPKKISVLDSTGYVLSSDTSDGTVGSNDIEDIRARTQNQIAAAIEEMLIPRVGLGNVRVQVRAEINTVERVITRRSFDPEQQVARSVQEITSSSQQTTPQSETSVQTTQPLAEPESADARSTENTTDSTTNFEIGETLTEEMLRAGDVSRLSVAVLVNGTYTVDDNGNRQFSERPAEEVQRIEALVKSAMGFDEARGDTVTVDSLEFIDPASSLPDAYEATIVDTLENNMMTLIKWLLSLIAVVAIGLIFVRPILSKVFEPAGLALNIRNDGQAATQTLDPSMFVDSAIAQPGAGEKAKFDSVEGEVNMGTVHRLRSLVNGHPDDAIQILRNWMYEEE